LESQLSRMNCRYFDWFNSGDFGGNGTRVMLPGTGSFLEHAILPDREDERMCFRRDRKRDFLEMQAMASLLQEGRTSPAPFPSADRWLRKYRRRRPCRARRGPVRVSPSPSDLVFLPTRASSWNQISIGLPLVRRFSQIDGYRCLSLIRALAVVNCQSPWLIGIAIVLPSCNFVYQVCLSGMRRSRHWDERTRFGLCHIEPTAVLWSVVPFEPFGQPPCFGAGKAS